MRCAGERNSSRRLGVILRIFAVRGAPEAPHRKVEPRRTELSFIIAVGRKIANLEEGSLRLQDVLHGPVDIGLEASAAFVVDSSPITDAGQDESMLDPANLVLIAGQPGNRADGPRHEQETVGKRCDARAKRRPSAVATATPDKLSLAIE